MRGAWRVRSGQSGKNMLTKRQAYLATFYYLDGIYDETRDENLGNLLSSMNPFLFLNSLSADPAIWIDWTMCVEKVTKKTKLSEQEAFTVMIVFLDFNQVEFSSVINKVQSAGADENWKASMLQARLQQN
jgi:hypothetical protein